MKEYRLTLTENEKHLVQVALSIYQQAGEEWRRLLKKVLNTPGEDTGCPECGGPVEPANEVELQPGGRGMARRPFCRACWLDLHHYEPDCEEI